MKKLILTSINLSIKNPKKTVLTKFREFHHSSKIQINNQILPFSNKVEVNLIRISIKGMCDTTLYWTKAFTVGAVYKHPTRKEVDRWIFVLLNLLEMQVTFKMKLKRWGIWKSKNTLKFLIKLKAIKLSNIYKQNIKIILRGIELWRDKFKIWRI